MAVILHNQITAFVPGTTENPSHVITAAVYTEHGDAA